MVAEATWRWLASQAAGSPPPVAVHQGPPPSDGGDVVCEWGGSTHSSESSNKSVPCDGHQTKM